MDNEIFPSSNKKLNPDEPLKPDTNKELDPDEPLNPDTNKEFQDRFDLDIAESIRLGKEELLKHNLRGIYKPRDTGIYYEGTSLEDIKADFKTLGITDSEYFIAKDIIDNQSKENGVDPDKNPDASTIYIYAEAVQNKLNELAFGSR